MGEPASTLVPLPLPLDAGSPMAMAECTAWRSTLSCFSNQGEGDNFPRIS